MAKKTNTNVSIEQRLMQGINSRFKKATDALDGIEDVFPIDALDGSAADLRQALKYLSTAQENISELIAYRKMMGVD